VAAITSVTAQFTAVLGVAGGIIGSITCCAGYRAAAVAVTTDVVSLGVDAEPNDGLPGDGMLDLVACGEECEHLESLATSAAHLLVPGPSADGVPVTQMRGRWMAARDSC
jgi:hypothetical protein